MSNTLICLSGRTPQVITETIYVLSVVEKSFIPDEVTVLTTQLGKRLILERLLAQESGDFHQLCSTFGLTGRIRFTEESVKVLGAPDKPLEDVRTKSQLNQAAITILNEVERATRLPGARTHASVAGGRKSLGAYLTIAMTLCAQKGDELSVVTPAPSNPPRSPAEGDSGTKFDFAGYKNNINLMRIEFPLLRNAPLAAAASGWWNKLMQLQLNGKTKEIPLIADE